MKKGFTLIEMIVSVALLGLLAIIIIVNLNSNLKKQDEKEYLDFVEKIKSATNVYLQANPNAEYIVKTDDGYNIISLERLEEVGLISMDTLIDPDTNLPLSELNDDDEKKYVKVYDDDKTNWEKSDATLIEYPAKGINKLYRNIRYEMNGFGNCSPNPKVVLVNSKVSLCSPSDENATFNGWYLDKEQKLNVEVDEKNEYKPLESLSLYAKWYKNKPSVIKEMTITSATSNYLDKVVNVNVSIYDVYGGDIKICISNSSNVSSCINWKEVTLSKGETRYYTEKIDLSDYNSSNITGSGKSVTLYVFVKNTAYTESENEGRTDTSLIASKSVTYQIYKYCSKTTVTSYGTWGSCSVSCYREENKNKMYRERTDSLRDFYYSNKSCGTKEVTGKCENIKNCCDDENLVQSDYKEGSCSVACGGGTKTDTITYISNIDKNTCKTETKIVKCNEVDCCRKRIVYYFKCHPSYEAVDPYAHFESSCGPTFYQRPCLCRSKSNHSLVYSVDHVNPVNGPVLSFEWREETVCD